MGAQHFQNYYEFKGSNDRGERGKKKKNGGWVTEMTRNRTPVVSAQEFPKYTKECQALFLPKEPKGNSKQVEELDNERFAAELGTVFAVCFPGCG